jgi:hypothetical protein
LFDAGQAYSNMLKRFKAAGGELDVQPALQGIDLRRLRIYRGKYHYDGIGNPVIELRKGANFGTRMEELVHHFQVDEMLKRGFSLKEIAAWEKQIEAQAKAIVSAFGFKWVPK